MYRPGVAHFERHQKYCETQRSERQKHFQMSVCADKLDEFLATWAKEAEGRTTSIRVYPWLSPIICVDLTFCATDSLKRETGYTISRLRTAGFKRQMDGDNPRRPKVSEALGTLEFSMLWSLGHNDINVQVTLDTGNSQVCRWEGTGEFDVIPESRVERTRMVCDENAALHT